MLLNFHCFTDGVDESSFPVAALLTGALLTIGVAVLLVIVLTIKKNREQSQPHENGLKEKHIGLMSVHCTCVALFDDFYFRNGHNWNNAT